MNDIMNIGEGKRDVPFFKKPGSVTGTVLLGLGGVFLLLHLNPIFVFLNVLMANTITFIGLCCALAAIVYCILDPKIRTIISELYFMLVRKLMGLVVDMDPISIVQHHIVNMKDKIKEIQKNMGSLKGLIKDGERMLLSKKEDLDKNVRMAKKSRENHASVQEVQVYDRQVVRLQGTIQRQEKRLEDAKKWYNILSDLKKAAELAVQDTENEVNERVEEWNMIKKQHKVFTNVMGILSGNDKLSTFTMAMDKMSYDITQKLGEMENIIEETGGIMTYINNENELTSDRASELLDKYDKFGIDGLLGNNAPEVVELNPKNFIQNQNIEYLNANRSGVPLSRQIQNDDKFEVATTFESKKSSASSSSSWFE